MFFLIRCLPFFLVWICVPSQEVCTSRRGQPGTCVNIRACPTAIDDIRKKITPKVCGFDGSDPIVCCESGSATTTAKPVLTTTSRRPISTTTEYVPPVYDYHTNDGSSVGGCEPIPADKTAARTGRKAWDKCIEYQEKLLYPCVKGVALTGETVRANYCGHNADDLILGGQDTTPREFPHMALLGFGDTAESAQYLCGGSIVSENYLLTAGHCTYTREYGDVTFAILGAYKRSQQVDSKKLYKVKRIIKHPNYKPPSKYNDIALLELERPITLNENTVPVCLPIEDRNISKAVATGWGAVQYKGPNADTMQKVTLQKFPTSDCQIHFPAARNMERGFDESTQLCYGDKIASKDTCQGDSGGPIQVKNKPIDCMYNQVGVTSFGRACGFVGEPGIYTRVAPFVSWIESVVWP